MVMDAANGELPPYALQLIGQVIGRTGMPLVVTERPGIGYDSQVSLGRASRPYHALVYVPRYRDHCLHFTVNAAVKILRSWEVPAEERLVPVCRKHQRLPPEEEGELRENIGADMASLLPGLSAMLYEGTVRQLTSRPMDIRVEREIADMVPEHGFAQRAYLRQQVADLERCFEPEIEAIAPARIEAANLAMNVVVAEEAAELSGTRPGPKVRDKAHRALGEVLRNLLLEVDEPGHRGDRVVTDAWAETLHLESWFEWRRLDEVR